MLDDFRPLPSHTDPRVALRRVLNTIRPAEKISVTGAAERDMNVNVAGSFKPFRRDVTPYMVEPTDLVTSRRYKGISFCGPSQSGKTLMLQSVMSYAITSDAARVALFQMSRDAAAEFERSKFAPMIRNSPALSGRRGSGRGSDTIFQKMFDGPTELTFDWPTITKLSSASIRFVLGTDYDHFPEDIGGEGDGYTLMRARARSFGSRGMVVVESSPGAQVTEEDWKPTTPHDSPPVKYGVLALYPQGTRGRWYWKCPHCGHSFEPTFSKLVYPKSVDPAEAGAAAKMKCGNPDCHELIDHSFKRELNLGGEWLHETAEGGLALLNSGAVRNTDLASYWLDGAAAAFSTWAELVTQFEQAMLQFRKTGDEKALKAAYNTGQAQPYFPRSALSENEVSLQGLKDKAEGEQISKGIAPSWTRYIVVSIDTQATSWIVGVTAFGDDGRHQPIDRFEVFTPPATAPHPEGRQVDPFKVAEDWEALAPLAHRVWPVDGAGYGLRPVSLGVDMQGGGSTTENAYAFYRKRRAAGVEHLWNLTRGSGGQHTDRVWLKAPERTNQRGRKVAHDIQIMNMATDRLKDAVSASLLMEIVGQNHCGVPAWMTEPHLLEFTAERRGTKGWEKKAGMRRNESLDHLVQARAQNIHLGGETIDFAKPVDWAVLGPKNVLAVVDQDTSAQTQTQVVEQANIEGAPRASRRPTTIGYLRR